jgi:hypothetical protein
VSGPSLQVPALAAARELHRAGHWDLALELLAGDGAQGPADAAVAALRAEILVERHWWRLDQAEPAEAAVAALAVAGAEPALAALLRGQLRYTRVLFGLDPAPDDVAQAEAAFAEASRAPAGPGLDAWATFWLGVLADNLHHDQAAAAAHYARALPPARERGDRLLESYVVRHQGFHLLAEQPAAGLELLRRSLYLRAALGARPQVAAAQAVLADALPPGDEPAVLREAALHTARELGLTWLLAALQGEDRR